MTGEIPTSGSGAFLPKYDVPGDQEAYEFHAIGSDVEAGLINPQLRDEALDKLQFLDLEPTRASTLNLEFRQVNPYDKSQPSWAKFFAIPTEPWAAVSANEVPTSAQRLVSRLFELTGANVVRDDLQEEAAERGVIIRRGTYKGSDIYFRERYDKFALARPHSHPHLDSGYLTVEVMGAERGEMALQELSYQQIDELGGIVGQRVAEKAGRLSVGLQGQLSAPEVNRENFEAARDLLEAASATGVKRAYTEELSRGGKIRQFLASKILDRSVLKPAEPKPRYVGSISRENYDRAARDPHVLALVARAQKRLIEHPAEFL